MSAAKLKCPSCGAPIPARNINIQKMAAVCEACDSVFTFDDLSARVDRLDVAGKNKRVPQPEHAAIERHDSAMHLSIKWSPKTEWTTNLVLMGLWLAVAVAIPIIGVLAGNIGIPLMIGALLGAFPAYYFVLLFINSTHVRIENGMLITQSTPLYFPGYGKKEIAMDEIINIYAEPSHYYGMLQEDTSLIRREDMFYDVIVELADGSRKCLQEFFPYSHAFYIVQEVERYLREEIDGDATLFDGAVNPLSLQDSPLIDGELPLMVDDEDTPRTASLKS